MCCVCDACDVCGFEGKGNTERKKKWRSAQSVAKEHSKFVQSQREGQGDLIPKPPLSLIERWHNEELKGQSSDRPTKPSHTPLRLWSTQKGTPQSHPHSTSHPSSTPSAPHIYRGRNHQSRSQESRTQDRDIDIIGRTPSHHFKHVRPTSFRLARPFSSANHLP